MADSSSAGAPIRSVCVYCGSSETTLPEYHDLATRLGAALAARGLRLVYGGGSIGLMGRCAKAAFAAGGDVLGIMPRFLERREIVLDEVPHRMVDTMHERKMIMFEESDAFIVLPGGIGGSPVTVPSTTSTPSDRICPRDASSDWNDGASARSEQLSRRLSSSRIQAIAPWRCEATRVT